jgi:prepilin-type N-terminal cleavage/methylation domain-containing protein
MRKGVTLIEMVLVIAILGSAMTAFTVLFRTLLGDLPDTYRVCQTNDTVGIIVDQIRKDIDRAKSLSCRQETTGGDLLLIELPEGTLAYEMAQDYTLRCSRGADPNSPEYIRTTWSIFPAKIQWQVLEKDGQGYALEISTFIECYRPPEKKKKLSNSYVFFTNALRKTGERL